jgi:hypothetical protein
MKPTSALTLGVLVWLLQNSSVSAQSLQCEVGPVQRAYGGNDWQIYSCDDGESLVFVSTPESTAHPFYFLLAYESGAMSLVGEGTGSKDATKAAHDELARLSDVDRRKLVDETKAVSAPPQND